MNPAKRVSFTAPEAALLIAAGRFLAEMRVVPFTETLASGLDKLRSASPAEPLAQHLASLQFVGVPAHTAEAGVRRVLERAWLANEPVTIRYDGSEGTTTRRVRLRGVVMERSMTFVNAFDLDKNEDRQFRLDRIHDATI